MKTGEVASMHCSAVQCIVQSALGQYNNKCKSGRARTIPWLENFRCCTLAGQTLAKRGSSQAWVGAHLIEERGQRSPDRRKSCR